MCLIFKERIDASAGRGFAQHRSARGDAAATRYGGTIGRDGMSDDDGFARHGFELLAEGDDARFDLVGWTQVDDQLGIDPMIDQVVQQLQQFGMTAAAEPALEYR